MKYEVFSQKISDDVQLIGHFLLENDSKNSQNLQMYSWVVLRAGNAELISFEYSWIFLKFETGQLLLTYIEFYLSIKSYIGEYIQYVFTKKLLNTYCYDTFWPNF